MLKRTNSQTYSGWYSYVTRVHICQKSYMQRFIFHIVPKTKTHKSGDNCTRECVYRKHKSFYKQHWSLLLLLWFLIPPTKFTCSHKSQTSNRATRCSHISKMQQNRLLTTIPALTIKCIQTQTSLRKSSMFHLLTLWEDKLTQGIYLHSFQNPLCQLSKSVPANGETKMEW